MADMIEVTIEGVSYAIAKDHPSIPGIRHLVEQAIKEVIPQVVKPSEPVEERTVSKRLMSKLNLQTHEWVLKLRGNRWQIPVEAEHSMYDLFKELFKPSNRFFTFGQLYKMMKDFFEGSDEELLKETYFIVEQLIADKLIVIVKAEATKGRHDKKG